MNKKKYCKIKLVGGGQYIQPLSHLSVLYEEISEADIGEQWELELIEITQEDYEKLPEFEGH